MRRGGGGGGIVFEYALNRRSAVSVSAATKFVDLKTTEAGRRGETAAVRGYYKV